MDPTETLSLMIDAIDDQEFDEARDYADDLIRWLAGGGFPPTVALPDKSRDKRQ